MVPHNCPGRFSVQRQSRKVPHPKGLQHPPLDGRSFGNPVHSDLAPVPSSRADWFIEESFQESSFWKGGAKLKAAPSYRYWTKGVAGQSRYTCVFKGFK